MKALIVAEDFAGMRAQGAGLAEKAGLEWDFSPVHIQSAWSHIPARFWPTPLKRVAAVASPIDTAVIISVGGTGGIIGAAIARREGLPIVQIQNPRVDPKRFDLVIANTHDEISGSNILISRNALHPVTLQNLSDARQQWRGILKPDTRPLLSVMIGGANGRFSLGHAEADRMASEIIAFTKHTGFRSIVTPSRRSDPEAMSLMEARLRPHGIEFLRGEGSENPYRGMLACADMIAVTIDSVSMISEAAATSVPVAIMDLPGRSRRIGRFVQTLENAGRVKRFTPECLPWTTSALDDTPMVAREMRRRLNL